MLARKGASVLLLERERFPRAHVGESLLPASVPVLEELGVRGAVDSAGFPRKWGATMVWGREPDPWSWYFRETNERYPHTWQVWRPRFDQILLDNARTSGVVVREETPVREIGSREVTLADGAIIACGFVVDASGQTALLGRSMKLRRWDDAFRNMAVFGYFDGARRLPDPDETNILVEAYPDGWLWTIPLWNGLASVGAVVDRSLAPRTRAKAFLASQIAQSTHTRAMLDGCAMTSGPFVLRDWSYDSSSFAGDGWVLAGDAACFIDPLFSSGVHLALSSGVMAAAYVVSAMKDPALGAASAPVYQELYGTQYRHFREMAGLFYSSNRTQESYFWEARRIFGLEDMEPREAFVRAVAGQPPRGYERMVIDRGTAPDGFGERVRSAESAFARRSAHVRTLGDRILDATPALAAGVEVVDRPVLGEGEFVWGHCITAPHRPGGIDVSRTVAELVRRVDGRRAVRELGPPDVAPTVVRTLFVDGILELR